jgi:glycosyltransferase involved in cell wall biosynthesis
MIDELSIIIPALNEEHYLPLLLQSIAEQDYEGKLEVIVVDGNSEDKTVEKAAGFKHKIKDLIIVKTERGISHQRNVGADKAKYKYLMFLDADVFLPKHSLSRITYKINPSEEFVITPLILITDGNIFDSLFVLTAYTFIFLISLVKPANCGMCLIVKKETHEKINGFDEKVVYAEDVDYGFRAQKIGAKYHFFFRPRLFTTIRRRKKNGRIRLAVVWLMWYLETIFKGGITNPAKYKYDFGNHRN